jgi:hypothetical protein
MTMDELAKLDEETGLSERDVVVSLRMLASGLVPVVEEKVMREAADEIVRLRAERDEARRMYCGRVSRDVQPDAFEIAKNHGWNCFPQEDGK